MGLNSGLLTQKAVSPWSSYYCWLRMLMRFGILDIRYLFVFQFGTMYFPKLLELRRCVDFFYNCKFYNDIFYAKCIEYDMSYSMQYKKLYL